MTRYPDNLNSLSPVRRFLYFCSCYRAFRWRNLTGWVFMKSVQICHELKKYWQLNTQIFFKCLLFLSTSQTKHATERGMEGVRHSLRDITAARSEAGQVSFSPTTQRVYLSSVNGKAPQLVNMLVQAVYTKCINWNKCINTKESQEEHECDVYWLC